MRSNRTRTFFSLLALPILASLVLPRPASAQCGALTQQFQTIALEPGNAFVAEYSTTMTSSLMKTITPPGLPTHTGLKSAARDSEGRVRIVRSAGNYTVKSTDGVVTEVERLNISICDPTTGAFAVLDTADKTATIRASRSTSLRIIRPAQGQSQSFCATLFDMRRRSPRVTVEDLGHNAVSGYDAVGVRIHFASLMGAESGASSYNELWCSDALGAILQQVNESKSQSGRGFKNESTMQNIERREPEVSLFQIPSDYTVLQRDSSADRRLLPRPIPAPANSRQPQ
jgi:hypothetical protein